MIALSIALGAPSAPAQTLTVSPAQDRYGNPQPGARVQPPTIVLSSNTDLPFINLTNAARVQGDVSGSFLIGGNLAGVDLRALSFSDAPNLRFANLSRAIINPGDGSRSGFAGDASELLRQAGNIAGIVLRNERLVDPRLIGRDLRGADLSGVNFRFNGASARNDAFLGANLRDANLSNVSGDIRVANVLKAADLRGVKFDGWTFRAGDSFAGRDLSGASFDGATLVPGLFDGANLTGATFKNAQLNADAFRGARLEGVSFEGARNFDPAILRQAEVTPSGERGCQSRSGCRNLTGVDLSGQTLAGADLRGLGLAGARLNIAGAEVDDTTNLREATLLDWGAMPSGAAIDLLRKIGISRDSERPGFTKPNDNLVGVRIDGITVDRNLLTEFRFKEVIDRVRSDFFAVTTAVFRNAFVTKDVFSDIDVPSLTGARIQGLVFTVNPGTNLAGADLRGLVLDMTGEPAKRVLDELDLATVGITGYPNVGLAFQKPNKNLRGIKLDRYEGSLAGLDLQDAVFTSLPGIPIAITSIQGADLSRAELRGAIFKDRNGFAAGARLSGADLRGITNGEGEQGVTVAMLRSAGIGQTGEPNANLMGVRLGPLSFRGGDLSKLNLASADFTDTALIKGQEVIVGADFTRANLSGTDFGFDKGAAEPRRTGLFGAIFTDAVVDSRTRFTSADLRGAIGLTDRMLRTAGTREPGKSASGNILGIRFDQYDGMDLSGLWLSDVSLEILRADLGGARLTRGANFQGAILTGASFADAQLRDTNFAQADLREADLRGTHAGEAQFKNTRLQGALFDYRTALPTYVDTRGEGMSLFVGKETVVATERDPSAPYPMHDRTILKGGTFVAPEGLVLGAGQRIEGFGTVATEGRALVNQGVISGDAENGGLWLIGEVSGGGSFAGLVNLLGTLSVEAGQTVRADKLWMHRGSTLRLGFDGVSLGSILADTFWLDGTLEIDLSSFGGVPAPMMMRASFSEAAFAPMHAPSSSFFDLLLAPSILGDFENVVLTGLDPDLLSSLAFVDRDDGFMSLRLLIQAAVDPEPGQVSAPATLLSLGAALLGLGALRRRKGQGLTAAPRAA